jgi:hypothetical protein
VCTPYPRRDVVHCGGTLTGFTCKLSEAPGGVSYSYHDENHYYRIMEVNGIIIYIANLSSKLSDSWSSSDVQMSRSIDLLEASEVPVSNSK